MEKKNNKPVKKEEPIIEESNSILDDLIKVEEGDFFEEKEKPIQPKIVMSFDEEVKDFLIKMINSHRARMTSDEAKKVEEYYNRKLGLAENIAKCDICMIKAFRRLLNIYGIK